MYVKPPRRQIQGGMYVPDNYHGTAFTESEPTQPTQERPAQSQQPQTSDAIKTPHKEGEGGGLLSSLFSGVGGLRSDDILLLALIVLLSRSDEGSKSAAEILPLLAILLFMG